MRTLVAGHNHQQSNAPVEFGAVILAIVNAPKPRVRLPLGRDTVRVIEKKNAFVTRELADWLHIAEFTDFGSE